jgi:hypothetical protein
MELVPPRMAVQVGCNIKYMLHGILEPLLSRVYLLALGFPWGRIFRRDGSEEEVTTMIDDTKATLEEIVRRAKCPAPLAP